LRLVDRLSSVKPISLSSSLRLELHTLFSISLKDKDSWTGIFTSYNIHVPTYSRPYKYKTATAQVKSLPAHSPSSPLPCQSSHWNRGLHRVALRQGTLLIPSPPLGCDGPRTFLGRESA
jgi:hypothetical protein